MCPGAFSPALKRVVRGSMSLRPFGAASVSAINLLTEKAVCVNMKLLEPSNKKAILRECRRHSNHFGKMLDY